MNQLDKFYRSPAITEKYRKYKNRLIQQGSSIVEYIIKHCLKWTDENDDIDITPSSNLLFTDASDIRIILNDFPYNFEPNVTHICVWSKLKIKSDPNSPVGDINEPTRSLLNRYVIKNFQDRFKLKEEDVMWFRNFPAIQSVSELSHIHILLRDFDQDLLKSILGTSGVILTEKEAINSLNVHK